MKRILLILFGVFYISTFVHAEKRVAFIIGNASYSGDAFTALPTPVNDALAIAEKLLNLGFEEPVVINNGKQEDILDKFDKFIIDNRDADVAVFYYSGHGYKDSNEMHMLVPVDVVSRGPLMNSRCISLQSIQNALRNNFGLSLLFLDACREFVSTPGNGLHKGVIYNDFEEINSELEDNIPRGQVTYWGTRDGQQAVTGTERISPFTQSIINHLSDDDEFRIVWDRIRNEVTRTTNKKQSPISEDSYTNSFYFNSHSTKQDVISQKIQQRSDSPLEVDREKNIKNECDWVDLGLPSGLLWAKCNVGASNPSDYGEYYAWGEISPKSEYYWLNYKWTKDSEISLTKYNTKSKNGIVDKKVHLDLSDDAASQNWGEPWRIPRAKDYEELIKNCTEELVTYSGTRCLKLTSKINGNSIYLPAAGAKESRRTFLSGENGCYLSADLNQDNPAYIWFLDFGSVNSSAFLNKNGQRYGAYSIRPVMLKQEIKYSGFLEGHEWIDLGLPSGLKWATCNLGATSPYDYGMCYAWGETATKAVFYEGNYAWCKKTKNNLTKYNVQSSYGKVDGKTNLDLSDDAARITWGGSWRIPTIEEFEELLNNCTSEYITKSGHKFVMFTSKINGKSIYLPFGGGVGKISNTMGIYWSSTLEKNNSTTADILAIGEFGASTGSVNRDAGFGIRPVTE